MARLDPIDADRLPRDLAALLERARRLGTPSPKAILTVGHNHEVLRGYLAFWESFFWNGRLEPELRELVRYFVAQRYACAN